MSEELKRVADKCPNCGKFLTRIGSCTYCTDKMNAKIFKDFHRKKR